MLLLTPTVSPQSSTPTQPIILEPTQEPKGPEGGSFVATESAAEQSETDRAVADLLEAISVAAEKITPQAVAPTQHSPISTAPTPPTHPPTSSSTVPPPPTHPGQNVFLPPLQATLPPLDLLKTPRHTTDSFLWPQHPVSGEKTENNGTKKVRAEKRKNNKKVTQMNKKKKKETSEEQIRYQKIKEDIRRKLNELEMQNANE